MIVGSRSPQPVAGLPNLWPVSRPSHPTVDPTPTAKTNISPQSVAGLPTEPPNRRPNPPPKTNYPVSVSPICGRSPDRATQP